MKIFLRSQGGLGNELKTTEMKYDSHRNITSLFRNFVDNYEWLNTVAKLHDSNRFSEVKNRLENIARNYNENTNQVMKDFAEKEIFLISLEAKRLNEAVEYLHTMNRNHLPITKIRSMCKGSCYHLDENPGNSEGRNIQFEFILGAFLKTKAGFKISDFDDITIEYASSLIRYECKRPALGKNIHRNFDEAVSQLEQKMAGKDNEYGIVALSMDKFDNINEKLFRGNDYDSIIKIYNQMTDNVFNALRNNIKIPSFKKVIGLHLFVSTLMWNKEIGQLTDISLHYTKKTIQEKNIELYDYLFNIVKEKLEAA